MSTVPYVSQGLSEGRLLRSVGLFLLCVACGISGTACEPVETGLSEGDAIPSAPSGTLRVLTYNVAGLPQGISSSNPETNIPLISSLLNDFDLVLVQEDFSYHEELVVDAEHTHKSIPWSVSYGEENIGDGLNRFSFSSFTPVERIPWPGCNGMFDCASDCLATKGFSVARHDLAAGLYMDVYNLHMEAGGCPEDKAIREAGMTLLLETIADHSAGLPVLVAGDFNLHVDDTPELVQLERLTDAGFVDACWYLGCDEEHIDRIFVRDGDEVTLEYESWEVPAEFVTQEGEPLSDHEPVAAVITFSG
jgi:endonuclease/exonuclease/phosphatase family metal-dependent hydrolase